MSISKTLFVYYNEKDYNYFHPSIVRNDDYPDEILLKFTYTTDKQIKNNYIVQEKEIGKNIPVEYIFSKNFEPFLDKLNEIFNFDGITQGKKTNFMNMNKQILEKIIYKKN
jgi:hypothetical protein